MLSELKLVELQESLSLPILCSNEIRKSKSNKRRKNGIVDYIVEKPYVPYGNNDDNTDKFAVEI